MDIGVYEIGQLIRITAAFTNAADQPFDPGDVYVTVTPPTGSPHTLHYGVDGDLVKDSVGNYHYDQPAEVAGIYDFRWYSTGSGRAASKGRFIVEQ